MVHTSIAINEATPLVYHNERRQRYANLWRLMIIIIVFIGVGFIIGMTYDISTLLVYILYTSILTLLLVLYCIDVISLDTTRALTIINSIVILMICAIMSGYELKMDDHKE